MNLKELRMSLDLTQQQFAESVGLERVTYMRYEQGTRAIPVDTLVKIADVYNVSTDYLLGRTSLPDTYVHDWTNARGSKVRMLSTNKNIPTPQEREDLSNYGKAVIDNPENYGAIKIPMPETNEELALLIQTIVDQRLKERDVSNIDE